MDKYTQNIIIADEDLKKEQNYWQQKLQQMSEPARFLYDNPTGGTEYIACCLETAYLPEPVAGKLQAICNHSPRGLYMLLLAGIVHLLGRYPGSGPVTIGMPFFKQQTTQPGTTAYLNHIYPLVLDSRSAGVLKDLLAVIQQTINEVNEYRNYPLEKIFTALDLRPHAAGHSLFPVIAALREIHETALYKSVQTDMVFDFSSTGKGIELAVKYNAALYREATVQGILTNLFHFYTEISGNTALPLAEIGIPGADKAALTTGFNNTASSYPTTQTIPDLFRAQVGRTPQAVAVVFKTETMSYRELDEKSDQLARLLVTRGVKPDTIVGLLVSRGPEMLTGMLGILKAGGAYLPLDPAYPSKRIAYMLQQSRTSLLVTNASLTGELSFTGTILLLEDLAASPEVEPVNTTPASADNLAYVIYTSGSTGHPKGVMIEHRAVVNFIHGVTARIPFAAGKSILALTTICFDIFVLESLLSLSMGLKIILAGEREQQDGLLLAGLVKEQQVAMLQVTPSRLESLLDIGSDDDWLASVSEIMVGGEAVSLSLLKKLQQISQARIFNMYGPTETTVWSTIGELTRAGQIFIGTPLANTRIYILDGELRLQPIGIPGELYIAGNGLARGYLGQPELTRERFIHSPHLAGIRLYKTGDLARWTAEGQLEFLGRKDFQVKIRGFRIELEEIAHVLNQFPGIKQCVLMVRGRERDKYLCAYYTARQSIEPATLKTYLAKELPAYMVPAFFMQLTELPLLPNNKINHQALPDPLVQPGLQEGQVEFETLTELKLAALWSLILGREKVSPGDNFINLGGNSLKAIELAAKMQLEFGFNPGVQEILKNTSLRSLARNIGETVNGNIPPIRSAPRSEYDPLSPAQQRIFFSHRLAGESIAFNIPGVFKIEGQLNIAGLKEAFSTLVRRHDVLRTSFVIRDEEPVQFIHPHAELDIPFEDKSREQVDLEKLEKDFIKPFDLGRAPLLRIKLVKLDNNSHLLLYDMHHIISDGFSYKILAGEIRTLYTGQALPPLPIQYRDYVIWLQEFSLTSLMQQQEKYWLDKLADMPPLLKLPYDFKAPAGTSFEAGILQLEVNHGLTEKLRTLAWESQATLFMVLLAAYFILLFKYTDQDDIVVGSPVAGRQYAGLENLIGMFVNMLTFRSHPGREKKFSTFLQEIKEEAFKVYANQDLQFDRLVNLLDLNRQQRPLFNTVFAIQDAEFGDREDEALIFSQHRMPYNIAKFDLVLIALEFRESLIIEFQYLLTLFKRDTIASFVKHYHRILSQICENRHITINEISISRQPLAVSTFKKDEGNFAF